MVAASDNSSSSDDNVDDKSALSRTGKGWGMPSSKCCNTMGKIGRIVMLPQYKIEIVVILEGKRTRRT